MHIGPRTPSRLKYLISLYFQKKKIYLVAVRVVALVCPPVEGGALTPGCAGQVGGQGPLSPSCARAHIRGKQ